MALPPCLLLAERVVPAVRRRVASRLAETGLAQGRIADELGVSQAMISRYLAQPAVPGDATSDAWLIERLSDEWLAEILGHDSPGGSAGDAAATGCNTMRLAQESDAGDVLRDLDAAYERLAAQPPLALMPQIGLNMARCRAAVTAPAAVAAFPARLVAAGDRLVAPLPAAFGASGHLARCLQAAHAVVANIHAIANVRGGADVAAAAGRLGWAIVDVTRPSPPAAAPSDADAPVLAAMNRLTAGDDETAVVHDGGGFGVEPCLYVPGRDAMHVAARILDLQRSVTNP